MKPHIIIDVAATGRQIKSLMEAQGYTVKDLCGELKLASVQSIYAWFQGRNLPTVDNLYALSAMFHVPMDIIVCGNREEGKVFLVDGKNNIYVIGLDMENRDPADIARDAAAKISDLFDRLAEKKIVAEGSHGDMQEPI